MEYSAFDPAQRGPTPEQYLSGEPPSRLFKTEFDAKDLFDRHIAPHYGSEQEFAEHYFAGHHSPEMEMSRIGNDLGFDGHLVDPATGRRVGMISREISPGTGTAYHGYLAISPSARGTGLAKELLRNQVDLYGRMGIHTVKLNADIDVGSYSWAKYGFLPIHAGEWTRIADEGRRRLSTLHGELTPRAYQGIRQILLREDPQALWDLSDMQLKLPNGESVAKRLLMDNHWSGKLDLRNPEQLERFKGYVK